MVKMHRSVERGGGGPQSISSGLLPSGRLSRVTVGSANVNGMLSKLHLINSTLVLLSLDALLLQETKLDGSIPDSELKCEGYSLFRRDRTRNGGGVAIFVREHLKAQLLTIDVAAEILAVSVPLQSTCVLPAATGLPGCPQLISAPISPNFSPIWGRRGVIIPSFAAISIWTHLYPNMLHYKRLWINSTCPRRCERPPIGRE